MAEFFVFHSCNVYFVIEMKLMKLMEALYFDTHFDFVLSNDISVGA